MKRETVIKSLADLSPEAFEPDRPTQCNPEPIPAGAKTQREIQVHVPAWECSDFAGYQHWGINE
jgi:hypothetical protein